MTPIVNGLESEFGDRILLRRLNVDEAEGRQAAQQYRTRGHPALILIDSDGVVLWSRVGVIPLEDLASAIEGYLDP